MPHGPHVFGQEIPLCRLTVASFGALRRGSESGCPGRAIDEWVAQVTENPHADLNNFATGAFLRIVKWHDHPPVVLVLLHLRPDAPFAQTYPLDGLPGALKLVEQTFADDPEVIAYIKRKSDVVLGAALRVALDDSDKLLQLIVPHGCTVDGSDLVVRPGARIKLDKVLLAFAADGQSLWALRSTVNDGIGEFDEAVRRAWERLRKGISSGVCRHRQ